MPRTIAICQFPTSDSIRANHDHCAALLREARSQRAVAALFCEGALSGYVDSDRPDCDGIDWAELRTCTESLMALARELGVWLLLGSTHPLSPPHKPHNSVYVINDQGRLIDRYDKRFCTGDPDGGTGELAHYSPGDHPVVFDLDGLRCGVLICHEFRYPELYRQYKRLGVDLIFHAFHAGNLAPDTWAMMQRQVGAEHHAVNRATTYPGITMPASMIAAAAANHLWVAGANSSAAQSCWGSLCVRADGVIMGQLDRHATGLLLATIDTERPLYDSTRSWRGRAMDGRFHSGEPVDDPRSKQRGEL